MRIRRAQGRTAQGTTELWVLPTQQKLTNTGSNPYEIFKTGAHKIQTSGYLAFYNGRDWREFWYKLPVKAYTLTILKEGKGDGLGREELATQEGG